MFSGDFILVPIGNDPSGSIKVGKFLEQLSDWQFLKDSAQYSG
jgi:hypothetical protein